MQHMTIAAIPGSAWAIFFARLVLGLIFGMAGWGKVFRIGAVAHARRYFLEPYGKSWIPTWLLWALGLSIPFVELIAGWLVFVGLFVGPSLVALGCVLAVVTYGHLLADFLYQLHIHVIPRLALVLFLLVMPREHDLLSLDHLTKTRGLSSPASVASPPSSAEAV